jgi:hypothetical protein
VTNQSSPNSSKRYLPQTLNPAPCQAPEGKGRVDAAEPIEVVVVMIPGLRLAPGGVDREGIMAEAPKSSAQPPPGVIRLRQSGASLVGRRVSVLSDSPKVRVENVG